MPPEIQRRPSDSPFLSPHSMHNFHHDSPDPRLTHQKAVQQQQHREALRLALGSILAPKRAPSANSRPTSGTASPAYPFSGTVSGTHTPSGTPPSSMAYPYHYTPYGVTPNPNATDHLHPSHSHSHSHGSHLHHGPSKLGRSSTPNSTTPTDSSPSSAHPSPRPTIAHPAIHVNDIDPMPLPGPLSHRTDSSSSPPSATATAPSVVVAPSALPARPAISPLQASMGMDRMGNQDVNGAVRPSSMPGLPTSQPPDDYKNQSPSDPTAMARSHSGNRSTFIQTLQSKSAWDALIHGSFS